MNQDILDIIDLYCETDLYQRAINYDDVVLLSRLYRNNYEKFLPFYVMDLAALRGSLKCLKYMHLQNEKCTILAMDWAADLGHLEVVKWLHYNRTEGCTSIAVRFAARAGHLEVVKFLCKNRNEGSMTEAIYYAVRSDRFEVVKFLYENRREDTSDDGILCAERYLREKTGRLKELN